MGNLKGSVISSFFAILLIALMSTGPLMAQGPATTILGTGPGNTTTRIQTDANGNLALSGTITGGNGAASNTGSAVPAQAGYTGVNISGNLVGATGTAVGGSTKALDVNCAQGCSAATTDTDDGSIATGQSVSLAGSETMVYDGAVWRRMTIGSAGSPSSQVSTIQGITSGTPVIVGDGSGALNVILDSGALTTVGTVSTVTAVTTVGTITNPVTITDGLGAVNTIVDSGTITTVTNPVTVAQMVASSLQTTATLAAGTAQIGHLEANQSVNVTQIGAGTSIAVDNGASSAGTQRVTIANNSTGILAAVTSLTQLGGIAVPVEDSPETANGTGIYAMSVRRDTAATSATTTGDNATINTDAVGALWVNIATTTTLGTVVEDAPQTSGGTLISMGSVRRDSAASSATTDGDNATINTDSLGRLWVNCGTGCSGGTQYNIDTVAGASDTGTLTLAVRDDSLATLTPVDGDYVQLRTNSTGALWVTSAQIDAAAGAAVTTNPVQTGGVYTNTPLTLDAGDAGYFLLDVNGRMQVSGAGTAGTPAGGVVSIQGVSSGTAVVVGDGSGALNVICDSGCSGGTQYTQDAALTVGSTIGTMSMGRASAAVPTDVSADNDAVLPWYLRSGAMAVQLTNAGVLTLSGSGTATGALRVELPTNGTGTIATVSTVTTLTGTTSLTPGTATANLGKAEDQAIGSGDVGVVGLFQAQATPTATAADNDYIVAKTNANGVLWSQPLSTSATGAAPPAMASYIGGLQSGATGGFLAGIPVCDSFARLNISTGTTTLAVTGVSGRHVRICSIDIVTAAANNVALISGTGATCGTGTAGMNGGTTAASGWNFAANGGIAKGSGIGAVNQTVATGDSVCVVTSAATQLSGTIAYTIY